MGDECMSREDLTWVTRLWALIGLVGRVRLGRVARDSGSGKSWTDHPPRRPGGQAARQGTRDASAAAPVPGIWPTSHPAPCSSLPRHTVHRSVAATQPNRSAAAAHTRRSHSPSRSHSSRFFLTRPIPPFLPLLLLLRSPHLLAKTTPATRSHHSACVHLPLSQLAPPLSTCTPRPHRSIPFPTFPTVPPFFCLPFVPAVPTCLSKVSQWPRLPPLR